MAEVTFEHGDPREALRNIGEDRSGLSTIVIREAQHAYLAPYQAALDGLGVRQISKVRRDVPNYVFNDPYRAITATLAQEHIMALSEVDPHVDGKTVHTEIKLG